MKMLTICRTVITYLIGICLAMVEVAASALSRAVEYVLAVNFNALGKELFTVAVHGLVKMITFPVTFADHFEKSCASFVAMLKGIGSDYRLNTSN